MSSPLTDRGIGTDQTFVDPPTSGGRLRKWGSPKPWNGRVFSININGSEQLYSLTIPPPAPGNTLTRSLPDEDDISPTDVRGQTSNGEPHNAKLLRQYSIKTHDDERKQSGDLLVSQIPGMPDGSLPNPREEETDIHKNGSGKGEDRTKRDHCCKLSNPCLIL